MAALPGTWDLSAATLLALKKQVLLRAFGLDTYSALPFHRYLGLAGFLWLLGHGIPLIILFIIENQAASALFPTTYSGLFNFAGLLSLAFLTLVTLASYEPIRRRTYTKFFGLHQLYTAVFLLGSIHCFFPVFYYWFPPIMVMVWDKMAMSLFRHVVRPQALVTRASPTILRIYVSSNGRASPDGSLPTYAPGMHVFVTVPQVLEVRRRPMPTQEENIRNS